MNPRELLVLLARFTVTGYGGLVELTCDRCGTPKTFGGGSDPIGLPELMVYARDHKCPAAQAPSLRQASRLVAV